MELLTERPAYGRLDDYFGLWAMHEETFAGLFQHTARVQLVQHVAAAEPAPQAAGARSVPRVGDTAVISIRGSMMKAQSSMSESTSTVAVRQQLREAARDKSIDSILMLFDTPGGTVAGTEALAADIRDAGSAKPVFGYIEDLCASAGIWGASQCHQLFTHESAQVGSIGTFMVVQDLSARADQLGIKVHVIKTGAYKGAGVPGAPITEAQLAYWQERVDQLNGMFLQAVASGRRMSLEQVKTLADGRTHVGRDALKLGLVDGVQSLDQTLAQLRDQVSRSSQSKARTMSGLAPIAAVLETPLNALAGELVPGASLVGIATPGPAAPAAAAPALPIAQPVGPRAATLAELKAACPNASADFLMSQLEGAATLQSAQTAFTLHLQQQLAAAQQRPAAPETPARPGNKPLGTAPTGTVAETVAAGSAVEQFDQLVRERMSGGVDRSRAILQIAKADPDLHAQFLLGTNPKRASQRLIEEKLG